MTNNSTLRSIFGKTLAIAFFAAVMTVASYAQSGNLYEGNSRFGYITSYQSTWVISNLNGGGEIKIYNCHGIGNGGIACSFTQFANGGKAAYSGQAQIYQSGAVYLRWLNDVTNGQRSIDSGWKGYQVR